MTSAAPAALLSGSRAAIVNASLTCLPLMQVAHCAFSMCEACDRFETVEHTLYGCTAGCTSWLGMYVKPAVQLWIS